MKNYTLCVLTLLLIQLFSNLPMKLSINTCTIPNINNDDSNKPTSEILTPEQKNEIDRIRYKVEKGEKLTEEDRKILIDINNYVAKLKLGNEQFEEFSQLMEKRKARTITDLEEKRLKELLTKLQTP